MKKLLALLFLFCILCTSFLNVSAAEVIDMKTPQSTLAPRMDYIAYASCNIYINSSGEATVKASINGYQDTTTKVTISAHLQQYKNGNWKTIKTFSSSKDSYRTNLSGTCSVSKGYSYRVQATVKAYSGSKSETKSVTSGEADY